MEHKKEKILTGPVELLKNNSGQFLPTQRGVLGLIECLNPLQFISQAISDICHYRYQIKELETQQLRISEEAQIRHKQIDAVLLLNLKIIEERSVTIDSSLKTFARQLKKSKIEKKNLTASINNLAEKLGDSSYTAEDRKLFHTGLVILCEALTELGKQDTAQLTLFVENTRKALEAVPQINTLLT